MEFADFRPYQPGDDLRYVDWKIAARADRWVVKQYEEETNLRATIVLDVSRSMDWRGAEGAGRSPSAPTPSSSPPRSRSFSFASATPSGSSASTTPSARASRRARAPASGAGIVAALEEPGNGRASDLAAALGQAARLVTRRGMVILISDLLVDIEP